MRLWSSRKKFTKKPARAFTDPWGIESAKVPAPPDDVTRMRKADFFESPGADELIMAEKGPRRPFKFEPEKPEPERSREEAWEELRKSYKKIVKNIN